MGRSTCFKWQDSKILQTNGQTDRQTPRLVGGCARKHFHFLTLKEGTTDPGAEFFCFLEWLNLLNKVHLCSGWFGRFDLIGFGFGMFGC